MRDHGINKRKRDFWILAESKVSFLSQLGLGFHPVNLTSNILRVNKRNVF